MKEEYLHFIFHKKMLGSNFKTTQGTDLKVLDFGEWNQNAGPDFLDCQIELNGQKWAGPIEFHVKASDWYQHGHQNDKTYQNVIAHFVYENDKPVRARDFLLPTVELKNLVDSSHYKNYQKISANQKMIACEESISNIPKQVREDELEKQLHRRLWGKSVEVLELLESYNGDRDQLVRVLIGRVFGGKVNQLPFESLVEQLSNRQLRRLKNKRLATEAYLFGQAGLLSQTLQHDEYIQNLQKEYDFFQQLFDQPDPIGKGWKYSRMRPSGFPDIRIAQFASLLHHLDELPKPTHSSFTAQKFKKWAQFEISTYWQTRYRLGGAQQNKVQKQLSNSFVDLLLINAIVPYLYALGLLEGKMEYRHKAIVLLKELPPEKNRMMREWTKLNQPIESAFHSQAYLALIKQGCNQKKCLLCNIGKEVLNL